MTDTELLDWLEVQVRYSCAHFDALRDCGPSLPSPVDSHSQAYRDGLRVRLFTVASQHVNGVTLRDAIRAAIRASPEYIAMPAKGRTIVTADDVIDIIDCDDE